MGVKNELSVAGLNAPCFSISVTDSASSAVEIAGSANDYLRLVNAGASDCFVAGGGASIAATVPTGTAVTTATPVLAGEDVVFQVDQSITHISAICASGKTATLYVQRGGGV